METKETQEAYPHRTHHYNAEATVLDGELHLPLAQKIRKQAHVKLCGTEPNYLSQRAKEYRLEGVISFQSAYTQVSGNPGRKEGVGWSTLATSVIEGLNVLDVVTADRVVSQMAIDHPGGDNRYIPTVSFLGSRIENLRIAGHKIDVCLDLRFLRHRDGKSDDKPDYSKIEYVRPDDMPWLSTPGLKAEVAKQHEQAHKHPNLIKELIERYTGVSERTDKSEAIECSLARPLSDPTPCADSLPFSCHGHTIYIPHFGTMTLANLRVQESDYKPETKTPRKTFFHLTMIDFKFGCAIHGGAGTGQSSGNGVTVP